MQVESDGFKKPRQCSRPAAMMRSKEQKRNIAKPWLWMRMLARWLRESMPPKESQSGMLASMPRRKRMGEDMPKRKRAMLINAIEAKMGNGVRIESREETNFSIRFC